MYFKLSDVQPQLKESFSIETCFHKQLVIAIPLFQFAWNRFCYKKNAQLKLKA